MIMCDFTLPERVEFSKRSVMLPNLSQCPFYKILEMETSSWPFHSGRLVPLSFQVIIIVLKTI